MILRFAALCRCHPISATLFLLIRDIVHVVAEAAHQNLVFVAFAGWSLVHVNKFQRVRFLWLLISGLPLLACLLGHSEPTHCVTYCMYMGMVAVVMPG